MEVRVEVGMVDMAYADLARSHVKECLREAFELSSLVVDDDGDLPFQAGTALYYVSVDPEGRRARVWSIAVRGVKVSAAVLRELNEASRALELSRVYAVSDGVVVEGTVTVDGLTATELRALCVEVGDTADRLGQLVATVHGGEVALPPDEICEECGH